MVVAGVSWMLCGLFRYLNYSVVYEFVPKRGVSLYAGSVPRGALVTSQVQTAPGVYPESGEISVSSHQYIHVQFRSCR